MDTEKSCPNCRASMKLESKTPGFLSFECPKCAFVLIEVAKEDAPQGRADSGRPLAQRAFPATKDSIQNSEGGSCAVACVSPRITPKSKSN
jgi:phage FluMu protein Com